MKKCASLAVGLILIVFLGIFSLPMTGRTAPEGKAVMESRCADCHGVERILSASKDRSGWESTINRMMSKGATLNSEEKVALIDYLVGK